MNGLTDIEWKMFNQAKFLEALGLEFDQKYGTFDFISQYGFDTLANYADYFMDPQKLNLKDNIVCFFHLKYLMMQEYHQNLYRNYEEIPASCLFHEKISYK